MPLTYQVPDDPCETDNTSVNAAVLKLIEDVVVALIKLSSPVVVDVEIEISAGVGN